VKKIKLVYIVSTLGRTGPTRQLFNLIKYLDRDQFQASVITLSPNPPDNVEKDFLDLGITVNSLALSRLAGVFFGGSRLTTMVNNFQPDILHSQGLRADWISSRLMGSYKRVSTQRNNPLEDYPPLVGRLKGNIAARLHYYALTGLPLVVACSQTIANANTRRGLSSKVIRNGVDLTFSKPPLTQKDKMAKRQALGLPTSGRLFLYAGPLIPRKNPELLVRAFTGPMKQQESLVILGDGRLLSDCRHLTKNAPNISLPGSVDCVADYHQVADLFVSASRAEGLPNAVLEALAAGLPALLSDIEPHQEILTLSPPAGWLFHANNLTMLSKKIEEITVRSENQHAARQLAVKHFSAEDVSKAYQQLYQELISIN